jgi:hypothetical protein
LGAAFFLVLLIIVLIGPHIITKFKVPDAAVHSCGLAVLTAIVIQLIDLTVQSESIGKKLMRRDSRSLLALDDAIAELFEALNRNTASGPVTIQIIGLNFKNMIKWVAPCLKESKLRTINIQLLLVTPNVQDLGKVLPNEVAEASRNMATEIETRKAAFVALSKELADEESRILNIEIRHYETIPPVFGLHVSHPFDLTYVHLCRFHYVVPDVEYFHRINRSIASAADHDLRGVLCGLFKHFWDSAPQAGRWVHQSPAAAKRESKNKKRKKGQNEQAGGAETGVSRTEAQKASGEAQPPGS